MSDYTLDADKKALIPTPHRHGPAERMPLGTIVRCDCGRLVRFQMFDFGEGSGGYAWFPLSRWQLWRKRHELAEAEL
jgi:hypothetical protein